MVNRIGLERVAAYLLKVIIKSGLNVTTILLRGTVCLEDDCRSCVNGPVWLISRSPFCPCFGRMASG